MDDLRLKLEELSDEPLDCVGIVHFRAQHLFPVLDQDGGLGILENYVVLRIAAPELLGDFRVEVVVCVLGFPIAARQPHLGLDQRAVHIAALVQCRLVLVFGDEQQTFALAPVLEQGLEGLAHDGFAVRAGGFAQVGKVVEVLLDEQLAHGAPRFDIRPYRGSRLD